MTTEITELTNEVRSLREEFHRMYGTRLTREQYAARRGESLATFDRVRRAGKLPPDDNGKWLLADVMAWEGRQ
jgi:hypothetical protein